MAHETTAARFTESRRPPSARKQIAAIAGGVGAAKFLKGLAQVMPPSDITVIGNTGDDDLIYGLHVSPDLDIVTYWLAGAADTRLGWGIAGDTSAMIDQLGALGVDTWFTLKDKDLAASIARTHWIQQGATLSQAADRIRRALGVKTRIIPMSNDPVRTKLTLKSGQTRTMQEYFVKHGHSEAVSSVAYEGAAESSPAPGVVKAINEADQIVICPSNPVLSIGPILSVPGIKDALSIKTKDVWAVSPIVAGKALKGPADKLMAVLDAPASASGVAGLYRSICGHFVYDIQDSSEKAPIENLGIAAHAFDTIMKTDEDAARLAAAVTGE